MEKISIPQNNKNCVCIYHQSLKNDDHMCIFNIHIAEIHVMDIIVNSNNNTITDYNTCHHIHSLVENFTYNIHYNIVVNV